MKKLNVNNINSENSTTNISMVTVFEITFLSLNKLLTKSQHSDINNIILKPFLIKAN